MAAFEKESKRLLLCLEEGQLVIVLVEKDTGKWNALENFVFGKEDWDNIPESLQNIKQQSALANLRVSDVPLFFRTAAALPIPAILKESSKLFLQTQFGFQPPDEMQMEEVNAAVNMSIIIPAAHMAAFSHVFPQATWHSTLALLIKQAQQGQGKTVLPQLFLTLGSSLAEMVMMKGDELLIARCFPYHTPENLLYHLLNTCRQLNINAAEIFIKAQGQIEEKGNIYQLLQDYFAQVELLTINAQKLDEGFTDIPAHHFTNLMVDIDL